MLSQTVTLNNKAYTVVGVLPAGFRFLRESDVYVPLGQADPAQLQDRKVHSGIFVIGRLKPGVTLDQARSDMALVQRRIAQAYPEAAKGVGAIVVPLKQYIVGDMGRTLMLFLVAVGFVLLIACANVANLMLARSNARGKEFAIRSALGAGRTRLIRQLLVESVLLGLVGGALGISIAAWGTRPALAAVPGGLPSSLGVGTDPHVLVFTLVLSIFTGILFGLAPSLQGTKTNLQESLKEGSRGVVSGPHRTQNILVIAETAHTLVLLVGAGLMVRTIQRLWATDPGFNAHDLLTLQVVISPQVTSNPEKTRIAFRQLLEEVKNIPGVDAAGLTNMVPLGDTLSTTGFWLGPQTTPPPQGHICASKRVVQDAKASPSKAPAAESSMLSVISCRTSRQPLAPRATRIPTSCSRAVARASVRLARLTQEIRSTRPTSPISTVSWCPKRSRRNEIPVAIDSTSILRAKNRARCSP